MVEDRPTEAGVPIFGEDDDVSWLQRRTTPAPPPPPFEAPPERPLFAPEPAAGAPHRTPRPGRERPERSTDDGFWPWDTGASSTSGSAALPGLAGLGGVGDETGDQPTTDSGVPGRGFLRVGVAHGRARARRGGRGGRARPGRRRRGRRPLRRPVDQRLGSPRAGPRGPRPGAPRRHRRPPSTPRATRRPRTTRTRAWRPTATPPPPGRPRATTTSSAPLGLKSGVGLLLDLGGATTVDQVVLTFQGTPTSVSLYVADEQPGSVEDLEPVAQGSADGPAASCSTPAARPAPSRWSG